MSHYDVQSGPHKFEARLKKGRAEVEFRARQVR